MLPSAAAMNLCWPLAKPLSAFWGGASGSFKTRIETCDVYKKRVVLFFDGPDLNHKQPFNILILQYFGYLVLADRYRSL
jgi:hypothetical protein